MRRSLRSSRSAQRGAVVLETLVATSIIAAVWIGLHLIVLAGLDRIALRTAAEAELREARASRMPVHVDTIAIGVASRLECDRAELVLVLEDRPGAIALVAWRRAPLLTTLLAGAEQAGAPPGGPWLRTEVALARPWTTAMEVGR